MAEKTLQVQKRQGCGKGPAGRIRAQGLIPGIYYTAKGDNIPVQTPVLQFEKLYRDLGKTTVFDLEITDENSNKTTHPALVWQVQTHPWRKQYLHIDFYGVDLEKEVIVNVPLEFVGVSKGAKQGGIMETYREKVRLSAKPLDMPAKITVDVTNLNIGDQITVDTLALPENVKTADHNLVIVSVMLKGKEADTDNASAE